MISHLSRSLFIATFCLCGFAKGDLIVEITGIPGQNATTWTLSGSAVSSGADFFDDGVLQDFDGWFNLPDLLVTNISDMQFAAGPGATITTSDGVRSVDTIFLDNDNSNGDELALGVTGNTNLDFATGTLVTWAGTFSVAGVDISDFNGGESSSSNFGGASSPILDLTVRVSAVPEPSSSLLLGFIALAVARRRNR